MTLNIFAKLAYKLLTVFISMVYSFSPYVAPSTADPIEGCADNGANMTVVAWADTQISNYMAKRFQPFDAACEDLSNAGEGVDALLIAGDIAENGLACEYEYVTEKISEANVGSYMMVVGNHDVRLRIYSQTVKNFTAFANRLNNDYGNGDLTIEKLNYTYKIKGYTFIVLGTDRTEFEESYISDDQLDWLDKELAKATADGKPAFVVCHQSLKDTHGLPDTWNSPSETAGTVGEQSDALKEIMNKYENVIMISGHLHTGIGQYTYEKIDNFHSVNLPSTTIVNKDGEYNNAGIGFMIEAYDNHVLFRARDFAQGIYIPDYDIDIPLS